MADRVRTHDAVVRGASAPGGRAEPARGRSTPGGAAARGGNGAPARGRSTPRLKADPDPGPSAPARPEPGPTREPVPITNLRRYRRRELALADGARLVLAADGTLTRFDAEGTLEHTWAPDDPEWPRLAIRFGLRSQPRTIPPAGRFVEAAKLTRPGG